MVSPKRIRRKIIDIRQRLNVSERKTCAVLSQSRSSHRYQPNNKEAEVKLRKDIVRLASKYGRYGYRKITALLRMEGWKVNHKCVFRINLLVFRY